MKVADFDYVLPQERIAQRPLEPRDHSRLMVVQAGMKHVVHQRFYDLPRFLRPDDSLVVNDTKVFPARLLGVRHDTGGSVELLLLRALGEDRWEVLVKPGRRVKVGVTLDFTERLRAEVLDTTEVGGRIVRFLYDGAFHDVLDELGETPLPPYITEPLEDSERYQTVYAKDRGSVAAPTAGLHFTEGLLTTIRTMGVAIIPLTLHVGLGTFRPVKMEDVKDHHMHAEYYAISQKSAALLKERRRQGGRVIAVGTTVVRTLETLAMSGGLHHGSGWTEIFIYPGHQFQLVDGMITNFHLPKSTLLMLVAAFSGLDRMKGAYQEALAHNYRFFSFGDAMMLLNKP